MAFLGLFASLACGGGNVPDARSGDEDFIPARDLSLAELASSQPPPVFERHARQARPSAFGRLLDDLESGAVTPAQADTIALQLRLGRLDEVPQAYVADDAATAVPDFFPYQVRMRLGSYAAEDQAALGDLLDDLRGALNPVAAAPGLVQRLVGPEVAYAAPAPAAPNWVEVLARDPSQQGRVGEVQAVAEAAWPQIASFMEISTVMEIGLDDEVRFAEPLSPDAQQYIDTWDGDPAAVGTVARAFASKWIVDFPGGPEVVVSAADLELVDPARAPLKVELTATVGQIPNQTGDEQIGGSFFGCRNIYVVSGDGIGQCTLAGRVVHELFHCAQALRVGVTSSVELKSARATWVVEGAAMWAMDHFRPADDHEWAFMQVYAATRTWSALDRLAHYSGLFFNYAEHELGGPTKVREVFDAMRSNSNRTGLGDAFNQDPAQWHRFVYSTTGYDALVEGGHGVELFDTNGVLLPYDPTAGCADDGPSSIGQESRAAIRVMSAGQAPIFDLHLPGPAAQHEIVQVVDVESMQYIDVAFFGDLGDRAATSDPEVAVTAVLVTQSGADVVQDWTELWASADGVAMEIAEDGVMMPLSADTSFRICMTDDAPCEDASETFADLSEIRLIFSWAGVPPAAGDTLDGQVALMPGAIQGWRGKSYRHGTPEEEHDDQ
jgi:hypothetical protein